MMPVTIAISPPIPIPTPLATLTPCSINQVQLIILSLSYMGVVKNSNITTGFHIFQLYDVLLNFYQHLGLKKTVTYTFFTFKLEF